MLCRECGCKLKITNTYRGKNAKSNRASCPGCKITTTFVTVEWEGEAGRRALNRVEAAIESGFSIKDAIRSAQ
jgi:hypothetical protein